MANPSDCPECDIIILSYGIIPGQADTLRHRSLAIEEMYGITAVSPALHRDIMQIQREIQADLDRANERQLKILEKLKQEPRK